MSRMSMNELTTYRWTFDEDVHHFVEAGIPAIGVWREKLADFGEERGIDLLAESGLAVSSLLWAGGFTGSDGRSFRESVRDAQEAIELASLLRAGCLVLYSGARGGHTRNHARRLLRSALAECIPIAEEMGVVLAVEPMHPGCAGDWTFLTSLDEALDLIGVFQNAHLRLAFDAYHMAHDARLVDRIPAIAAETAIVQLGDAKGPPDGEQNRCRLGLGVLDLRALVRSFLDNGYSGFFDVELMGEEIEESDYGDLLAHSVKAVEGWLNGAAH
ncbi:MAG: sugar phosphate isomerase/epimerase [Planctomycetes bacterium]|nr:sugar phosphate isomerase/epimerase [Planctomycetota bacterium]